MKHILSGVLTSQHRTSIQATVDEIVVQPGEKKAFQLMPMTETPAAILEHEIISGFGGKTQERTLNTQGKQVSGISSKTKIFEPGYYQEFHRMNEREILKLRKFGTIGERGVTGLTDGELNYTGRVGKKLQVRLENRLQQLIWDAIFTGKYVYQGIEFDFLIPAANKITSTTDWSDIPNAKILSDLDTIFNNTDVTRKYLFKEIVMNPITAIYFRQALMKEYGINNVNVHNASVSELAKFYLPELPAINVVRDMMQEDSVDADGQVTAGNAQFFVPNDKILLVPDFSGSEYGQYGEFEITENINDPSATLDKPAVGVYTFVDEKGLEEKKSPYMDVVAGFNGAPNLKRSNDTIILSV